MSWWSYVTRIAATDAGVEIAKAVRIDQSTVSRWKTSDAPGNAVNVAKLARAYNRPVLEAFVAAGFLTEGEAKVRPAATPDLSQLSNDELLELVRARMREEDSGHGAPMNVTPLPPTPDPVVRAAEQVAQRAANKKRSTGRQKRTQQDRDAEQGDPGPNVGEGS